MTAQNNEMPRLSALICTRNGARTIEVCLEALCTQEGLEPGAYEIIIVDNNSTDETARVSGPNALGCNCAPNNTTPRVTAPSDLYFLSARQIYKIITYFKLITKHIKAP